MPIIIPRLLEKGVIKPNATVVFQDGSLLERANGAFQLLRENKANGRKVVVKIDD
jgi:predicted DNA-binding antitoxin AbrB/MazE fold protein